MKIRNSREVPSLPVPAQMDPSKLAPWDTWTHQCSLCPVVTQGGTGGWEAHMAWIHPGQ